MSSLPSSSAKKLLLERLHARAAEVRDWRAAQARHCPPPFYCSVDLRDSGHKIVPVDCNIYPAGFNNLCPDDQRGAVAVFKAEVERFAASRGTAAPRRVLILPEAHTSNAYYIENLHYLSEIVRGAGFELQLGWYGDLPAGTAGDFLTLRSQTGKELQAFPIRIQGGELSAGGFVPELILLNNDFSSGYPAPLDSVRQPIVPSHRLGWHSRRKSDHFVHYNALAEEFAGLIGLDPWILQVDTQEVRDVNFNEELGIDRAAAVVDEVLERTRAAYEKRQIRRKPFAFVKNNAGTYGMGIMVVRSGDEVRSMNRRTKNKMSVGKNRLPIESVVVQEGVPTATLVDRLAAEPVVYLMGAELIGGFLRTNTEKSEEDNLNSAGMVFRKLCMSDLRRLEEPDAGPDASDSAEGHTEEPVLEPVLERVYGTVAMLSALAAGRELAALSPSPIASRPPELGAP